jgi:lipopolysaccharide export system protein LptA
LFLLLPVLVIAQIRITSDSAEIQDLGDCISMHFFDNANIDDENFHLGGDTMQILISKNNRHSDGVADLTAINEIHAIGNGSFWQGIHSGKADKISIYPSEKILVLEGNAEISDAETGTVHGNVLVFDSANGRVKTGKCENKRHSIAIDGATKHKPHGKAPKLENPDEKTKKE